MESQPQNPEFRINPENFHQCYFLFMKTGRPYTTGAHPTRFFILQACLDSCTTLDNDVPSSEANQVFRRCSKNLSISRFSIFSL